MQAVNEGCQSDESAAILAWLTDVLNVSKGCLAIVHRQNNPSSTHWIVEKRVDNGRERLFIKRHASPTLFSQERDALSALAPYASRDEPFAVPKMVAWSGDLNCIALEWIEGSSIGRGIRSSVGRFASGKNVNQGVEIAYRVGEWLQCLKARTVEPPSALPHDAMLARFREMLQSVQTASPRVLSQKSRLLRAFERGLADAQPEANCLVHNDFWFDHIWTRGDQIVVLDFGRAQVSPAGRDAVQFYCRLIDMAALNPFVSGAATDDVRASFLRGYGSLDPSTSINLVWQLWTRVEQLAGLIEFSQKTAHYSVSYRIRVVALVRQLIAIPT